MSDNIIQLNEDLIKHDLKDLIRSSVQETLNALLDKEADELKERKLSSAAKKVQEGIEETLAYMDFPTQHWTRIRTH